MRIHVLSDLHLEFGSYSLHHVEADVRVFAGDTGTKLSGLKYALANSTIPTIYIAGNHEYYGGAIPRLTEKLRACAAGSSVIFLENEQVVIGNTRFLGCTLWTDFLLLGIERRELAMFDALQQMNDYKCIRKSPEYCKLHPATTRAYHFESIQWLRQILLQPFDGRTVVITHHAPSQQSLDPRYQVNYINAAYASNLDALIEESAIDLWIHGHTHYCVDYKIQKTRIVSNPRGYPGDPVAGFSDELVVTVGT